MSSRRRKPGVNSSWYNADIVDVREFIARLDFERYDATLRRVHSHPKNLLRLYSRRIAEAKESKRNSSNLASFKAAVRRTMQQH